MRRRFVRHWKQKNMQSISEWMLKAWNECCKGIGSVTSSSIDFRRELKEIISLTCFPVISILKFWPQTKYIPVGSLSNHVCQMHCKNVVYFKYLKLKACFLVRLVRSHQENFVTLKIFPRKKKRLKGCWSSKKKIHVWNPGWKSFEESSKSSRQTGKEFRNCFQINLLQSTWWHFH